MSQSSTRLLKEAQKVRESYQRDATDRSYNDEFNSALTEVERYRKILEKSKEQEKVINFQKAKISALQSELDEALKS